MMALINVVAGDPEILALIAKRHQKSKSAA
jgi:hypothetical protein